MYESELETAPGVVAGQRVVRIRMHACQRANTTRYAFKRYRRALQRPPREDYDHTNASFHSDVISTAVRYKFTVGIELLWYIYWVRSCIFLPITLILNEGDQKTLFHGMISEQITFELPWSQSKGVWFRVPIDAWQPFVCSSGEGASYKKSNWPLLLHCSSCRTFSTGRKKIT